MTAPDPFVPPDTDISSLNGFLLDVERLLTSELVAIGSPEECWAALMLWCRAWKQKPSGSLPNEDRILASFSGAGRRWPRVREMALHGFVLCSDGRLYHRFLCDQVLRAKEKQDTYRSRRETDRQRLTKWRERHRETADEHYGNDKRNPFRTVSNGNGNGKGKVEEEKKDAASGPNGHDDLAAEVFTLGVRILTRRGVPERQARSILGGHRKTIQDDGRLLSILASVERNNPVEPIGYLAKAVKEASKPFPGWMPNEGVF